VSAHLTWHLLLALPCASARSPVGAKNRQPTPRHELHTVDLSPLSLAIVAAASHRGARHVRRQKDAKKKLAKNRGTSSNGRPGPRLLPPTLCHHVERAVKRCDQITRMQLRDAIQKLYCLIRRCLPGVLPHADRTTTTPSTHHCRTTKNIMSRQGGLLTLRVLVQPGKGVEIIETQGNATVSQFKVPSSFFFVFCMILGLGCGSDVGILRLTFGFLQRLLCAQTASLFGIAPADIAVFCNKEELGPESRQLVGWPILERALRNAQVGGALRDGECVN
jgi:hypothetical protein